MREASHEDYMATDPTVGKGLPFRQQSMGDCVREGVTLQQLTTDELRSYSELFDDGDEALDIDVGDHARRHWPRCRACARGPGSRRARRRTACCCRPRAGLPLGCWDSH